MGKKVEHSKKTTRKSVRITEKDQSNALPNKAPSLTLENGQWETKRGRPKEFDPDYAIELMETEIARYINGQMTTYEELEIGNEEKRKIIIKPTAFPTLIDIALKCGITSEHLAREALFLEEGRPKNKQLYHTYKAFKEMTLSMLIKGGINGDYEPRIVQFLANVNHDMIPKTQVEQTVEIKSLDKVFAELEKIHADEAKRLFDQKLEMEKRKAELDSLSDD